MWRMFSNYNGDNCNYRKIMWASVVFYVSLDRGGGGYD